MAARRVFRSASALLRATVLALFLVAWVPADDMPVSPTLHVPLLLKVLEYDRNFSDRAGAEIRIGIVYQPGNSESRAARDQVVAAFSTHADKTIRNVPIAYSELAFANEAGLAREAEAAGIRVFYVVPMSPSAVDATLRVGESQGVLTTTGVPDYVDRGVAVGIGVRQDKPQVIINLPSAKAVGTEFDASLLRAARVIR